MSANKHLLSARIVHSLTFSSSTRPFDDPYKHILSSAVRTVPNFEEKVLRMLTEIRDQQRVHEDMLRRLLSLAGLAEPDDLLPDDVVLPISSKEQFQEIERRLANESFQRNMVRLDSKQTYFGASLKRNVQRFDLLLQVLITHRWWPVA